MNGKDCVKTETAIRSIAEGNVKNTICNQSVAAEKSTVIDHGNQAGRVGRRNTRDPDVIRTTSGLAWRRVLQGKAVVEHQDGEGFMIMFPDGNVTFARHRALAELTLKRWAKRNLGRTPNAVGILRVEWR